MADAKRRPLIVTIDTSHSPESPCEFDGWKLHSFARNKFVTDCDPEEYVGGYTAGVVTPANKTLAKKLAAGLAFWLSYFEHGDGQWSLKGEGMQCRWDTASLAGILVWEWKAKDLGPKTPAERREDARKFLDRYSQWANGYVYDWEVREPGQEEPVDDGAGSDWIGTDYMIAAIRAAVGNRSVIARGDLSWMLSKSDFSLVDEEDLVEELLAAGEDL